MAHEECLKKVPTICDCIKDDVESLVLLKQYLDSCIKYWRERKLEDLIDPNPGTCACYIDAFQSVRTSVFGELLP